MAAWLGGLTVCLLALAHTHDHPEFHQPCWVGWSAVACKDVVDLKALFASYEGKGGEGLDKNEGVSGRNRGHA